MKLSIRWKLILAIGIPLVLVYGGMVGGMLYQFRNLSGQQLETDSLALARDYASMIEHRLLAVERVAEAAGRTLEIASGASDANLQDWLQEKVGVDPLIHGARIGFLPGVLRPGDDVPVIHVFRDDEGLARASRTRQRDGLAWFLRPLEHDGGVWTGPFVEPAAGGIHLSSYGVPVHRGGEPVGVVTVDVALERIQQVLSLEAEEGNWAIVASDGSVVSHEDARALGGNIIAFLEDEGREDIAEIVRRVAAGETGVARFDRLFGDGEEKRWVFYAPIGETGWSFLGNVPEAYAIRFYQDWFLIAIAFTAPGLVLILFLVWLQGTRITRPVGRLAAAAKTLGAGDLDARVRAVETGDELEDLADTFNRMGDDLKEHVAALTRETAAREAVEGEVRAARRIQTSLLPDTFPDTDDFLLHAVNIPARRVAGDFFDFFPRDDETQVFLIADVSGKGVPAALFMAMARTVLRQTTLSASSVAESVAAANDALEKDSPPSMYVTLFLGWYHVPTGTVRYVNAGHPPPYRVDASGKVTPFGTIGGTPAGLLAGQAYDEGTETLEPGERLVLFTDGVPEAESPDEEFFGEERFEALLSGWAGEPSDRLCERIAATVDGYQEGHRSDDLTLVVLERKR